MDRTSHLELTARGLFKHYLPQLTYAYNIRPTKKPGAKRWQVAQANKYGFDLDGLEGDIYIEEWRTIIELQGNQHKREVEFFTKGDNQVFQNQIERDSRKIALCRKQNISLYHAEIFDLLPYRFEPFIKQLMKEHGLYDKFNRTTPPRMLYAIADRLSHAKIKTKNSRPYRKPGLWPLLQRMWRRHKQYIRGQSRRVYGS